MKGIVFTGDRKLELMEFPDPEPGPRDVILEIKASGMCGTDLGLYRRSSASITESGLIIGGHEPSGIVAAVGKGVLETEARVGDRVMDHHYEGCGHCRHCKTGWTQSCVEGPIVYGNRGGHGAHAKYMKVPVHTLVPLPEELSFQTGAAIACGTGTAYGALKRLGLEGDETIAVFGQGPVGLSATQLAAAMGARVIAVDPESDRREMALSRGAEIALDPSDGKVVQAIMDLTHGEGADKSLDATNSADARRNAVQSTRTFGSSVMVGVGGEITLQVLPDLIRRQLTLIGHQTFSKVGQADCARFVASRKIDIDSLFTHKWKLHQAEEAYDLFDQQKTGKGFFEPA
ncbi:MAG: zinc-binding dehydrogenase [Rhodospirillales bacterium]|jgi:threonine dehydrogenase-like Zn-dependent dehydrogenase